MLFLIAITGNKIYTIDESDFIDIKDEVINHTLTPGIYYIVVAPYNTSTNPYQLTVSNIAVQTTPVTYKATLAYDLDNPMIATYGTTVDDAIACQFPILSNTAKLEKIWVYLLDLNINGTIGTNSFEVLAEDYYGSLLDNPIICLPTDTGWKSFDVSSQNIMLFSKFTVGVRFDGVNSPGIGYDPYSSYGNTIFYSTDYQNGFMEDQGTYSIRAEISYTRNIQELSTFTTAASNYLMIFLSWMNPLPNWVET